ncbi:DUF2156 domain-containing protein [Petrocella sp. FN5]|uniref:DUF2156 domain-containing protein n=1 Tax=Petrocella sp. FN5 TaxID=3032002 RepID=UPI0023DB0AF6|nr:phosphatidylglycerol lysyltransferase domain-containing protein [Petrocella sp. FN5]MDF1618331.1 phosphatidylglycerol lysyltransferase domain-containing protein [Petrocella sp. FN5]
MELKPLTIDDQEVLTPYIDKRSIPNCEYCFATLYLWNNRYNIRYAKFEHYILLIEEFEGKIYAIMPLCEESYFDEATETLIDYFHSIRQPVEILVTDEIYKDFIEINYKDQFEITTDRKQYDYLYDAEALRTLKGKKLSKKRNHLNSFKREYEGRWRYEEISSDRNHEICEFVKAWGETKGEDAGMLADEIVGVCKIIEQMTILEVKVGAIYIDDVLKAVTIGSLMNHDREAVIHIEKADPEVRGLYQAINQEFLIHAYPNVEFVNREDDLGLEGLRKAKLSYYPIDLIKKYNIREKV